MMPRWLRSLLIAAVAGGAAAFILHILPGWHSNSDSSGPRPGGEDRHTREGHIDTLSEAEKEQMLQELGRHV